MDTYTAKDAQLVRIGYWIYNAWEVGVIDFDTCERSLETLNSLADDVWLGIPEPQPPMFDSQKSLEMD